MFQKLLEDSETLAEHRLIRALWDIRYQHLKTQYLNYFSEGKSRKELVIYPYQPLDGSMQAGKYMENRMQHTIIHWEVK